MTGQKLWTSDTADKATGGTSTRGWRAGGVSIDSRTVEIGDLFIALRGPNFDGHDYAADALRAGAVAAVVDRRPDGVADDAPLLLVDDTMAALEALGRAGRARMRARVIAITGSVGKTGTKEALKRALEGQAPTQASLGNLNNHWGAPLSLARMPSDTGYAILELGMNHAGELTSLSELVRPHVAIITTVEAVHLEFFNSVAEIADAKSEVFAGLEPGGTAIINRDNPHYERMRSAAEVAGAARIMTFGGHREADARLINLVQHPTCNCISADIDGQAVTYKVGAPGRHWAMNSLAVLAAVRALAADLGLAALALADMAPSKGRGRRHRVDMPAGSFHVIDESYNASPVAMRAALELLGAAAPAARGRRIAVLGDMLELGEAAPRLHAELAEDLLANRVDLLFACGSHMAHLFDVVPRNRRGVHTPDAEKLLNSVLAEVRPGDVVMVKGSLGVRMQPIVQALLDRGERPRAAGNG